MGKWIKTSVTRKLGTEILKIFVHQNITKESDEHKTDTMK